MEGHRRRFALSRGEGELVDVYLVVGGVQVDPHIVLAANLMVPSSLGNIDRDFPAIATHATERGEGPCSSNFTDVVEYNMVHFRWRRRGAERNLVRPHPTTCPLLVASSSETGGPSIFDVCGIT